MFAWVAEGGGCVSARRPTCFLLLRQKKVGKEKATPLAVSLRSAAGNLRGSRERRCRRTRCALAALRSDNCGKSDHEAWASFGAPARLTRCASRHVQRGSKPETGHRCARPWERTLPRAGRISCLRQHYPPPCANAQLTYVASPLKRPRSRPSQRTPFPDLCRELALSPLPKRAARRERGEGASAPQGGVLKCSHARNHQAPGGLFLFPRVF